MARPMLLNLPPSLRSVLWAEAVNAANYILNRLITKSAAKELTPHKIMYGIVPSIKNFRKFGSRVYTLKPKPVRNEKFAERAREGVLAGFCSESLYRIYYPDTCKISTTKNIKVDEESVFCGDQLKNKTNAGFKIDDPAGEIFHENTRVDLNKTGNLVFLIPK